MKPLAPNTLLQNRYLVVHLIGKGGMGEVYLAVDQRLGSAIALKRTLHGDNVMLGDAFEREARTLARLRHPVLPKVSDHFIENDNQYLVMEHISGDDLAKRLTATQKPFPLSWVLFWADQLLDALAYLHSHEPPIIHRDIKPQNLKLTDDNNIVLLDFGLSKNSVGQTISNTSGGSTGSVVGYTPHYAPMEQIRGTGTNPRSDIYSLSATLYQLMTNVVPPDALSRADFLLSGKTDPIAPINDINSEIPKAISDVVLKGMSISQDQRFPDAREMQKVLRETYARMQSEVEAADKTIAFNLQDEPEAVQNSSYSGDKTEQFSNDKTEEFSSDKTEQLPSPVLDKQPVSKEAMGAQTIPFGMMAETAAEAPPTASQNADKTDQIPNFDATLRMDEMPKNVTIEQNFGQKTEVLPASELESSQPKQANVKTDIMGSDFGAAEYLQENKTTPPQNFKTDNFSSGLGDFKTETENFNTGTEDFSTRTDGNISAPPSNFTGDKTIPFIESNNQPANVDFAQTMPASAFDSTPKVENYPGSVETMLPVENYPGSVETRLPVQDFSDLAQETNEQPFSPNYDSRPQQQPPVVQPKPEKKKSKGLLFAVLGGLFGLLILAAAGGGIAYYMMVYQPTTGGTNVSTPTPEPSVTVTPTPEPSPEQANTNTDTGNTSNSNTLAITNPDNTVVNTTPTPGPTKPSTTQQQQQQQQTQTTRPEVTTKEKLPRVPKQTTVTPKTTETKSPLRGKDIPQ